MIHYGSSQQLKFWYHVQKMPFLRFKKMYYYNKLSVFLSFSDDLMKMGDRLILIILVHFKSEVDYWLKLVFFDLNELKIIIYLFYKRNQRETTYITIFHRPSSDPIQYIWWKDWVNDLTQVWILKNNSHLLKYC